MGASFATLEPWACTTSAHAVANFVDQFMSNEAEEEVNPRPEELQVEKARSLRSSTVHQSDVSLKTGLIGQKRTRKGSSKRKR